jgi:predicted HicB family RNase H-like nuclease
MDKPKRPRGRPPVDDPQDERYELRLSKSRLARYQRAADKAGKALAAWIKKVLDRASR